MNLALVLAAEGAKVGILDADIYGPSISNMLGGKPASNFAGRHPHGANRGARSGDQLRISGLLTITMVWRGPMASKALLQMLRETMGLTLDYLVLDMPPGTGDIQPTLAQNIPVTGAVVVTTPPGYRADRRQKGIVMFEEGGGAGTGYRREHEHAYLQQLRAP